MIRLWLSAEHLGEAEALIEGRQLRVIDDRDHIDILLPEMGDHTIHKLSSNPFFLIIGMNDQILDISVSYGIGYAVDESDQEIAVIYSNMKIRGYFCVLIAVFHSVPADAFTQIGKRSGRDRSILFKAHEDSSSM